jgi:hypothetical protein
VGGGCRAADAADVDGCVQKAVVGKEREIVDRVVTTSIVEETGRGRAGFYVWCSRWWAHVRFRVRCRRW